MKILTHNVYWLQGFPSRWGTERVAEVPEVMQALEDLYRPLEADVICLQEVHRPDLGDALARALGMACVIHAAGGRRPDYGGVIMARRDCRLWDCTRPAGATPHERIHLRASLQGDGGPFEIASVHLPSNRYAGSAEAGHALRLAELASVLAGSGKPDLVVGDMNCRPDSPPYRFMRENGYQDAALTTGPGGDRFPAGGVPDKPRVDYMWLAARHQDRMKSFSVLDTGSFRQVAPDGATWLLSDHPPLVMEIR